MFRLNKIEELVVNHNELEVFFSFCCFTLLQLGKVKIYQHFLIVKISLTTG